MRKIQIDFNKQNSSVFGGYEGEHNSTTLIGIVPDEMICDEIVSYHFDFTTAHGEYIVSPDLKLNEENKITIKLWQQLMVNGRLQVQIVGLDSEQDIVSKSPVCVIIVRDSAIGLETDLQGENVKYITDSADLKYDPISENAQSGIAVAEAIEKHNTDSTVHSDILKDYAKTVDVEQTIQEIDKALENKVDNEFVCNNTANAIKKSVSGEIVLLENISPIEHELAVKLYSETITDFSNVNIKVPTTENIIPYPYKDTVANSSVTKEGITYTFNNDGTITANGTTYQNCFPSISIAKDIYLPAGTYYFSGGIGDNGNVDRNRTLYIQRMNGSTQEYYQWTSADALEIVIPESNYYDIVITIGTSGGTVTCDNITFKPMLTYGVKREEFVISDFDVYTANSNGEVEGIFSSAKTMVMFVDTPAVNLSCEFNIDSTYLNENNEEAHEDIRSKIKCAIMETESLSAGLSSLYRQFDSLENNALTKEAATWYDNLNLAVNGVFEFKANSLIFCSGNGKNLTLRKWNGTAYETLVENSPTIICICSNMQYNNDAGTSKWEALFVYQTEKSYGLVTLPTMVVNATTISPTYDNTLTVTNTGNENTNNAYIFYQHTGE